MNTGLARIAWENSKSQYEIRVYFSDSMTLIPGDKSLGAVTDLGAYGRIISVYENSRDNTIMGMSFEERKWRPLFTVRWDSLTNP